MKKFLSKMPAMIVLLALVLAGLVFYVVMLARPVRYGMTYVYSETSTEENTGGILIGDGASTVTTKIQIKSDKRAVLTMVMEADGAKITYEYTSWAVRNGDKIVVFRSPMTEEEYNQQLEALKADETLWNAFWENPGSEAMMLTNVNAFKATMPAETAEEADVNLICNDAIIYTVLWGVFEIALITFGALSTVFFVKGKKAKSENLEA